MKRSVKQITIKTRTSFCVACLFLLFICVAASQERTPPPVVVSAQMEKGSLVYKVNGKRVEDSKENSLITNLARIVSTRGTEVPILVIVDVHAPFTEIGKLETALDKVDLVHSRRLFITDFRDATMNEIHWDQRPIPIPSN